MAKIAILQARKPVLEAKKAVLEAKRPILEAKMLKLIWDVDFLERSVEWRRPLAKLEPGELSLELGTVSYAGPSLAGCGGFKRI